MSERDICHGLAGRSPPSITPQARLHGWSAGRAVTALWCQLPPQGVLKPPGRIGGQHGSPKTPKEGAPHSAPCTSLAHPGHLPGHASSALHVWKRPSAPS